MTLDRWAAALHTARANARPIPPLTDATPDLSIEEAYAIAERNVAARVAAGAQVVGHKIGLTSVAVQRQLGVGEPDYGALLDVMEIPDGGAMSRSAFIAPRVELELAFHLGAALRGPGVSVEHVRAATESVQAAIEIVDSRVADWKITLADTVADNASSGAFVLGGPRVPLETLDAADLDAEFRRDGEMIETGNTSAVLGDPCAAVAWLANALAAYGTGLDAGHIVLSGACTRMVPARVGDVYRGTLAGLGGVTLSVAP
jgi:2-keto-4-pentenoate hydratase